MNGWEKWYDGVCRRYWVDGRIALVVEEKPTESGFTWRWRYGSLTRKGTAWQPGSYATNEEAQAAALATWRLEGGA